MNKKAPVESVESSEIEYDTISENRREEYDGTSTKKATRKRKAPVKAKRKKKVPQELESPTPNGLRRKNTTIYLPHTPQPIDDEEESGSAEAISKKAQGLKLDVTSIDR